MSERGEHLGDGAYIVPDQNGMDHQQLSRRYRDTPRHIRVIAWLLRFL